MVSPAVQRHAVALTDRPQLLPGPRRTRCPCLWSRAGPACRPAGESWPHGEQTQGWARGRASRPGWKLGFRVDGLRETASLCVQSCPTAAPPKPYPRFLRTPDPLTTQEKSLQMPCDPHGCHGHGLMAAGGGVAMPRCTVWRLDVSGCHAVCVRGCQSLVPHPIAMRPRAPRISGKPNCWG